MFDRNSRKKSPIHLWLHWNLRVFFRALYDVHGKFVARSYFLLSVKLQYNKERQECVGAVAALFVWFFVVHYVLGPHSVPWCIVPEMFNQASRPKAVAIAAFSNWTMNSVVAILFWPVSVRFLRVMMKVEDITQEVTNFLKIKQSKACDL